MLHIESLTKTFKQKVVLDNVSLDLDQSQIYGLIGRNGSGKSTFIRILTGLYTYESGKIDCQGNIEYLNDRYSLPGESIAECLDYYQYFDQNYNLDYFYKNLEQYNIDLATEIKEMSKGQRSILALLLATSSSSPIIIIDEIFDGLDKIHRNEINELLIRNRSSKLIILVDHNLDQLEQVIDKVLVLKEGKITESFETNNLSHYLS